MTKLEFPNSGIWEVIAESLVIGNNFEDRSGWKPCILCGKELHSACAASSHLMVPFDNGDVACIDCCKDSGEMVELDMAEPPAYSSISNVAEHYDQARERVQDLTQADLDKCQPQADSRIPKEGESSGHATRKRKSSAIFSKAVRPSQRQQREEQSSEELLGRGVRSDVEEIVDMDPPANPVTRIIIPYNNWPKISDEDLERIPRNYNSFIVPLFEKRLNHEDASTELGRILLPKVCAEAYFPKVTGPQGVFIHAHDIEGREHLLN
ncbi:hypothetical protein RJ641_034478 [Dillenia turbinata]|uniref:VAL1-3 N-terminal zinc finger domain-containing protein n=1 Tax=Dillenia turbinata TaxID=194707 RepID=A0AAN8ZHM9_9MAGN